LDLGKYKSVTCLARPDPPPRFTTLTTSPDPLTRRIDAPRPDIVLIEACLRAGGVGDRCAEPGVTGRVATTARERWKCTRLQSTTDRDDAWRLSAVSRLGKFPSLAIPAREVRARRALIETRPKLVGRRTALPHRSRAVLVGQGLPAAVGPRAG